MYTVTSVFFVFFCCRISFLGAFHCNFSNFLICIAAYCAHIHANTFVSSLLLLLRWRYCKLLALSCDYCFFDCITHELASKEKFRAMHARKYATNFSLLLPTHPNTSTHTCEHISKYTHTHLHAHGAVWVLLVGVDVCGYAFAPFLSHCNQPPVGYSPFVVLW